MTSPCAKSLPIRVDLSATERPEIQRQLRSEFGPSVIDSKRAEEVKEMLALADKKIEDYRSVSSRLYNQMGDSHPENLQVDPWGVRSTEKQQLVKQKAQLCALLAPIRRLPNETLLQILQDICQENIIRSPRGPLTRLPAMVISCVCSRWRELALSSPSLWANLTVQTYSKTWVRSKNLTGFIDVVARYLARSGDWPLRLALEIRCICRPAVMLLTQQAGRWKTFRFWSDQSLTEYNVLSQLQFPLLAELDIASRDLHLFENSPRLRVLAGTRSAGPIPKVFHSQLDHLTFNRLQVTDLAETLRYYPSLKSLKFYFPPTTNDTLVPGTWDNIISLNGPLSDTMLSSFNFPSLNKLEVTCSRYTLWTSKAFLSFVSRSSMITTFALYLTVISDLDLIAVLQLLPSLLHLKVHYSNGSSQDPITLSFISSLTHQPTSISLVPKLNSLDLQASYVTDTFDDSAFVRMVQSRWFKPGSNLAAEMLAIGRACIRSIVLDSGHQIIDAGIYQPLRDLEAEGLRVVVKGKNGV